MPFKVDVRGIGEFNRKLKRLARNLKSLEGENRVPLSELLTSKFLGTHSRFLRLEDLVRAGGFVGEEEPVTLEAFKAIPGAEWDAWIAEASDFANWEEMQKAAAVEYMKRRIEEGL